MDTKICSKCGRELPLTEFYKNKAKKDGLQHMCKECYKQYHKQNRETRLKRMKQYNAEHKDEKNVYNKQYKSTEYGYASNVRSCNLYADRKYGRIGTDEDPLPPLEYYIKKFSEGIDFYDGKKYPFNELGFDRIDNSKPHTIENIVCCTTKHNIQRCKMPFDVFCSKFKKYDEEI